MKMKLDEHGRVVPRSEWYLDIDSLKEYKKWSRSLPSKSGVYAIGKGGSWLKAGVSSNLSLRLSQYSGKWIRFADVVVLTDIQSAIYHEKKIHSILCDVAPISVVKLGREEFGWDVWSWEVYDPWPSLDFIPAEIFGYDDVGTCNGRDILSAYFGINKPEVEYA